VRSATSDEHGTQDEDADEQGATNQHFAGEQQLIHLSVSR